MAVTGPVARFARQIAGQGYIVAAPSSYHDFTGSEALAYDVPGTDQGNEWKVKKVSFPAIQTEKPLENVLVEDADHGGLDWNVDAALVRRRRVQDC